MSRTGNDEAGSRIEVVSDATWSEFTNAHVALLILAESGCPACAAWSGELSHHLGTTGEWAGVRFGKIDLDLPTSDAFRTTNAEWLKLVEGVPFNVLYVDGVPRASFAGAGIQRLRGRLSQHAPVHPVHPR